MIDNYFFEKAIYLNNEERLMDETIELPIHFKEQIERSIY